MRSICWRVIYCLIFFGINAKSNGPNLPLCWRIKVVALQGWHWDSQPHFYRNNCKNACIDQQSPLSGFFSEHLFLKAILDRKAYKTMLNFIVTATQPNTPMVATQGSCQGRGPALAPGFLLSPTKWVAQPAAARTSAWPLVRSAMQIAKPHGSRHRTHRWLRKAFGPIQPPLTAHWKVAWLLPSGNDWHSYWKWP